jgi:hypothetical protein
VAPDFVSHYYLPDRRPFLNLSDLDDESIAGIDREMAPPAASSGRSALATWSGGA